MDSYYTIVVGLSYILYIYFRSQVHFVPIFLQKVCCHAKVREHKCVDTFSAGFH